MERALVGKLGGVAAQGRQLAERGESEVGLGVGDPRDPAQERRQHHQVVERHRPSLGHPVVPHAPELQRLLRIDVGEVERVAELVQERAPVVVPAVGLEHEFDLVRDAHGGAEGPRGLRGALLDVELDPAPRRQVEPHRRHHLIDAGDHRLAGKERRELLAVEHAGQVVRPQFAQIEAGKRAPGEVGEEVVVGIGGLGEERRRRGFQRVEVDSRQPLAVVVVIGVQELLRDLVLAERGFQADGIEVLLDQREARPVELHAGAPLGLLADPDRHPAVRDPLAIHLHDRRRFGGQIGVPEVAGPMAFDPLGQELAQVRAPEVVPRVTLGRLHRVERIGLEQRRVAVVDRLDARRVGSAGERQPLGALQRLEEGVDLGAHRLVGGDGGGISGCNWAPPW